MVGCSLRLRSLAFLDEEKVPPGSGIKKLNRPHKLKTLINIKLIQQVDRQGDLKKPPGL